MGSERKAFFGSLPPHLNGYQPLEKITIGDHIVGKSNPALIIAEIGSNHLGNLDNAFELIEAAAEAGADAVKFQHLQHYKIAADVEVHDTWKGKMVGKLSDFYKAAELPYSWTPSLIDHAKSAGLAFLSTPFDNEAVDLLDNNCIPAFKVASYEMTDDIFLGYIASKGRPMIVSTGMATLEEVAHAVNVMRDAGNNQIILLHCVSQYPPEMAELNLRAISTMAEAFKLPIGWSDHSKPPSYAAAIAAVALGACVIERHIALRRSDSGNDPFNSLEPGEFTCMVREIRNAEAALSGSGIKQPVSTPCHERDEIWDRWARRSVYAGRNMSTGQPVNLGDVVTLRPWGGMSPRDFLAFAGHALTKPINAGEPLTIEHFLS